VRKLLIALLITATSFASINLTTQVEHMKIVNGAAGLELMVKASARFQKFVPIIYKDDLLTKIYYGTYLGLGFSQQYTAPRANQFAYNHFGDRLDWSIGAILEGVEIIYTHSIRNTYAGANPDVLFYNQDVDSLKVRWKGQF